ncbi:AAA family ATPase [Nocardiopsis deserti]|uniref:AAA family ATPase n=1 Tax=Nocardiopsis deserti TaxID=2605988 RepID=UPI00123C5211|nr:MoxR family ATPase [Nocardiopsis deserti]
MTDWRIFRGTRKPHEFRGLPDPPPWRAFDGGPPLPHPEREDEPHAAVSYLASEEAVEQVNTALYLRRPLLVTGPPGAGKSALAEAVAHELRLGPLLYWPITSRVTLRDGLYRYDPLGRLYSASRAGGAREGSGGHAPEEDVGDHIRLGPLGTALLPFEKPRVLLIDEIDKSDIDLPNDLLTVFERGSYEIPELMRVRASGTGAPAKGAKGGRGQGQGTRDSGGSGRRSAEADGPGSRSAPGVEVLTADGSASATIRSGRVQCRAFPLVVMTSNGERAFPPAFLRRCVKLELRLPEEPGELAAIVHQHLQGLPPHLHDQIDALAEDFLAAHRGGGVLATDQLLNAAYMRWHTVGDPSMPREALARKLMRPLNGQD